MGRNPTTEAVCETRRFAAFGTVLTCLIRWGPVSLSHIGTGQRAFQAIFILGFSYDQKNGAEGRIRTTDTGIFSAVLYQAELPRLTGKLIIVGGTQGVNAAWALTQGYRI